MTQTHQSEQAKQILPSRYFYKYLQISEASVQTSCCLQKP